MTLTYKQAVDKLNRLTNYEKESPKSTNEFSVETIKVLLAQLKDPCHHTPIIHIAGTKGKGSTSWYCASLLRSTGIKVGLFTSPHFVSVCERIMVDGVPVSEQKFAYLAEKVMLAVEVLSTENKFEPTWFDMITAMAMLHFHEEKVIAVVLEVGLGGRLDSTNFCNPVVSVITKIAFDHILILGNTLSAIAMEKGGIIKKMIPVVSCQQEEEVMQVLRKMAELNKAPLKFVGEEIRLTQEGPGMDLDTGKEYYTALVKGSAGHFQWENAALAVAAVEILAGKIGLKFGEQDVRFAIANTQVPGRMEHLGDMFVDCAHNPLSMKALAQTLKDLEYSGLRLILGMARDKLVTESLKPLAPLVSEVWCVTIPSRRSMEPEKLCEKAQNVFPKAKVKVASHFKDALRLARLNSEGQDPILVTGSVYLVGEALKEKFNQEEETTQ